MKVEVNQKEVEPNLEYPCIKISDSGNIVLFVKESCGVVLSAGNNVFYKIGKYHEVWNDEQFTPFTGTITLSND